MSAQVAQTTGRTGASPQRGRLERWRLEEPVRFYLYGVTVALAVVFVALGAVTGEWQPYATAAAAVVLGMVPAIGAARASVYSAPGVIAEITRMRDRG